MDFFGLICSGADFFALTATQYALGIPTGVFVNTLGADLPVDELSLHNYDPNAGRYGKSRVYSGHWKPVYPFYNIACHQCPSTFRHQNVCRNFSYSIITDFCNPPIARSSDSYKLVRVLTS